MPRAAPSTSETWDAFFSDFYLRAYADAQRQDEARAQALAAARRRAAAGPAASSPAFVRADYRKLPFPDASFDAAVNLFSSLGYLGDEEDVRVLAEIGRVLRPGSRLV